MGEPEEFEAPSPEYVYVDELLDSSPFVKIIIPQDATVMEVQGPEGKELIIYRQNKGVGY